MHFINEILEIPADVKPLNMLDQLELARCLINLNHIVYFGLKTEDALNINLKGSADGYGIIMLP